MMVNIVLDATLSAAALDATDLGIIILNPSQQITLWNRWIEHASGIEAEFALGTKLCDVFPCLESSRVQRGIKAALDRGLSTMISRNLGKSPFPLPTVSDKPDDFDRIQHTVAIKPLRDTEGGRHCLVEINDVTASCRRERALRKETIENKHLAARNHEVAQTLEAMNERLARSNNELSNFAHAAAHDLRAPLRHIRSFGQFLMERYSEGLDSDAKDYLSRILQATMRMDVLIKTLLNYAKAGRNPLNCEEAHLSDVLGEVVRDCQELIDETGAVVEIGPLPTLEADQTLMYQVFLNLLSNALKYQRKDTIPEIHFYSVERNGIWNIYCKDNGIGFKEEDAERMFEPFQRLVSTSEFEGTGIGLATVKKIMERHGGGISAVGDPGAGACFCLRLPASCGPENVPGTGCA
ncbi:MAG: hypothetical protein GY725_15365 [bacterium]|nr:hypothetical protein [bacterium]